MTVYARHPYSAVFEVLAREDFDSLVADIKAGGLNKAITLYKSEVLDGWNRFNACLAANVEPRFVQFEGDDAAALRFVKSENLERRHLNHGQKIIARGRLALLQRALATATPEGKDNPIEAAGDSSKGETAAELARELGVSPREVKMARAAERNGLGDEVLAGRMGLREAAQGGKKHGKSAGEKQDAATTPAVVEKLTRENDELRAEVVTLLEDVKLSGLTEEQDGLVNEVRSLREQLRVAESQRDDFMLQCSELKKEVKRLQRKLGVPA